MRHVKESFDWQACPHGVLKEFSSKDKTRHLKRQMQVATGIGLCLCVVVGVSYAFTSSTNNIRPDAEYPNTVALTCIDAMSAMDAYFAGDLDAKDKAAVEKHLSECAHCRALYMKRARSLGVSLTIASRMGSVTSSLCVMSRCCRCR